jgi:flagellar secretion chaperone FliS
MISRPTNRYQMMEVSGMSGPRLVVFLYSHLLASLQQGQRAISAMDHEARCTALCRARDLVYELFYSLDRDAGGQLAENLGALYQHYAREITEIDLRPNAARLAKLIQLIASLHEAWEAAARQVTETPVPAAVNE